MIENNMNPPKKKIIILNGPPNVGKDTLADHLVEHYNIEKKMFKGKLYSIAAELLGYDLQELISICDCRTLKETKGALKGFEGTPREFLIDISERMVKPVLGKNYFSKHLLKSIEKSSNPTFIVSDGGFVEETLEILKGGYEVFILRLKRGDIDNFKGDSRSYLRAEDLPEGTFIADIELTEGDVVTDCRHILWRMGND